MKLPRLALAAVLLLPCLLPAESHAQGRAPRIVLDPGHGGAQEGAKGPEGLLEKEVALQIARRVRTRLERVLGAQVWLTRDDDSLLPLPDRVSFANLQRPDVFISIHANSMPTRRLRARIEGIETYFLSASASNAAAHAAALRENADGPAMPEVADSTLAFILRDLARTEAHADSSRLAYALHPRLVAHTKAVDRGVFQAPFYVLGGVEVPAVLIEVGYISHPVEGPRLGQVAYQEKLAAAIVEGVQAFLAEVGRREAPQAGEARSAAHTAP